MSFGTNVPNVGGARRDWSNVIIDGVVVQRGRQQRHCMAQQINLDAIAEVRVLLQLVSGGVRPCRRRPGPDRHARAARRTTAATSTTTSVTRRSTRRTSSPTAPTRIEAPRTDSTPMVRTSAARCRKLDKKLFFFYSMEAPLVKPARAAPQLDACRQRRDARATFRRRWTVRAGSSTSRIRCESARATPSAADRMLPRQHHPGRPHQLERTRAPEHALPGQQFRPDVHARQLQLRHGRTRTTRS